MDANTRRCECGQDITLNGNGFQQHQRQCEDVQRRAADRRQTRTALREAAERANRERLYVPEDRVPADPVDDVQWDGEYEQPNFQSEMEPEDEANQDDQNPNADAQDDVIRNRDENAMDRLRACGDRSYILKVFHPRTGLPERREYMEDEEDNAEIPEEVPVPLGPDHNPYLPFSCKADFYFAHRMIATDASINDINWWLRNMHNGLFAEKSHGNITFKNARDMFKLVDAYVQCYAGFEHLSVSVEHKNVKGDIEVVTRNVWRRNTLNWLLELVSDPTLGKEWEWHAYNQTLHLAGQPDEFLITAPMNAETAWKIDATLPGNPSHAQIPLTLYSDKSNAARFATSSIHPVALRPANLSKHIANRNGQWSSNGLVGMLDDLSTPEGEDANASNWALTRRKLYHASMELIVQPLAEASKNGHGVVCGDGVQRIIYPHVMITNMDHDEKQVCACGRGNRANYPCPRCHVPRDSQSNILEVYTARNHRESKDIVMEAQRLVNSNLPTRAENLLKEAGLYAVCNAFWVLDRTDIYHTLSIDPLHTIWIGLFGDHLFPMLRDTLSGSSRRTLMQRFATAPSFPKMKRILKVDGLSFADGKKYFAVLQQILPYVQDLVHADHRPLLRLIRSLADLAMHLEMDWQTESRLNRGRDLVREFADHLADVKPLFPDKNFNFPKLHELSHMFDDIFRKGPTSYLNCILGENMHQGLIQHYAATNKREFIEQILLREMRTLVSSRVLLHVQIHEASIHAALVEEDADDLDDEDEDEEIERLCLQGEEAAAAAQRKRARDELEASLEASLEGADKRKTRTSVEIQRVYGFFPTESNQRLFEDFHNMLRRYAHELPRQYPDALRGRPIGDGNTDPNEGGFFVTAFKTMKHRYISLDDGSDGKDIIRCSPSFHGRPRHDTVLVQSIGGVRPARLHLVFKFDAFGHQWPAALVTHFKAIAWRGRDRDIKMRRYLEEDIPSIIPLGTITRACYMSPTAVNSAQYYLNGFVSGDVDMYVRHQSVV